MPEPVAAPRPRSLLLAAALTGILFAAAYGQAPLYYSNQNQYFLHGLARAAGGSLAEDWLANTLDPTPVFSALVEFTASHFEPWLFHAYHALLLTAYAAALFGVFVALAGRETASRRWPLFAALLVLVHSAAARWASYRLFNEDYPWFLQAGVAGQYVLGAMFQPSAFGVLLVVAVALFALNRPLLAAACVGAAGIAHATYVLPGGLLLLGFMTALALDGRRGLALASGALGLGLMVPVAVFGLIAFAPTSPELSAEAQRILVHIRIPHHCRPDLWLDGVAGLQIAWAALGVALMWGTRLFSALAVPLALSALLTGVQTLTGSDALALLFPWRVSAVLVPVATAVILARLCGSGARPADMPSVAAASFLALGALAVCGVWVSLERRAFHTADEELPLYEHVARTAKPGNVYLLPVRVPGLPKRRGSLSSDFQPVAAKRADDRVIPVDLQRFRIHAGAAAYVDFKSIPYKDAEVVEWLARMRFTEAMQEQLRKGDVRDALKTLRARRVTHVVLPAAQELAGPGVALEHRDPHYRVYFIGSD
jgi:hypothetical protein